MEDLQVGDRVANRPWKNESTKFGEVVRCYNSRPTGLGAAIKLYAVKWDEYPDQIDLGYMRHGLVRYTMIGGIMIMEEQNRVQTHST